VRQKYRKGAEMRLTYDKRLYIEESLKKGVKVAKICRDLGISRTSFYREIHRSGMDKDTYSARIAQIER
jgi:IS30 family transposase